MCVCMITGMVFLYVNVCLYLNVNFVILYVVVQRAKRKTAVAILVPQFSYFNFHMNFSCKLSVYIYIYVFSVWRLKINSILFYSILFYELNVRNDKMDDNNFPDDNSLCITLMKQKFRGPIEAHGPFIISRRRRRSGDGRYCNAPRPSVHLSVRPSVRHV